MERRVCRLFRRPHRGTDPAIGVREPRGLSGVGVGSSILAVPMSNVPHPPGPPNTPRPRRRIHPGYIAALLIAAAVGLGYVGARALALPEPRPVDASGRLKIDVVQPVEPMIVAGGTMEVGDLENSYRYVAPPREAIDPARYERVEEPTYLPEPPARPRPLPEPERPSLLPIIEPAPPPVDRWFGFDRPDRDYRAEREARRARREARDQREYEQYRARNGDWEREQAEAEERRRWSDLDYPPDSTP